MTCHSCGASEAAGHASGCPYREFLIDDRSLLTRRMQLALHIARRDGRVSAGCGEHGGHVERVAASTIFALVRRGLLTKCYSSEGGVAGMIPSKSFYPEPS